MIGSAGVAATAHAGPRSDLAAVVRQLLITRSKASPLPAPEPQVNIAGRTTSTWGFGTAVLVAPKVAGAYPEGWLFIAYRDRAGWTAALEGERAFADLASRSPILSSEERKVFGVDRTRAEALDRRTGLRLPYANGQTWTLTGGPHPMSTSVRSSIDLSGGDGKVLSARAGLAYTMCSSNKGWIRVVHDRGWATDYYHLEGNLKVSGKRIGDGVFLGNIGNDVSCGGSSTGAHVHFSLRYKNKYVAINGHAVGKWVIRQTAKSYEGYALHGSERADVGDGLYNYGRLGFRQGIVDTDGGGSSIHRAGPGTSYAAVGESADGDTLDIVCSARGETHTGRDGVKTNLWSKLKDGSYVSDAFLWTGRSDPVNGWCP
ncbi:peptidoglycan DD-metalloendopeptidase family protein [Asanoa siamensis]|uniref:peptidoglycan DD-metalloendopeptidase family protein n=1 Tax=Asanoa siamensis TaxID=926357 RepID=UPI001945722D|nr:peptidoglycan DD-metalloendopeptidase family protein [Asanoa siamensis]